MIGDEITDVEGVRNSPFRGDGNLVGVGVDLATDLERVVGARVEFVRFFCCVALWAESNDYHASLLNLTRSTVGVDGSFDFGVVGNNLFVDVPVELREVVGICVGFLRVGSRRWNGNEVDG